MKFSLRTKTIIGIACIEAVLLASLVATLLYYMRTTNEQGLIERVNTTTALFATTSKDAVLSYDLASLEDFATEVMKNTGMVYARVIGPNNALFAESGDKEQLAKKFQADNTFNTVDDEVFDSFAEIIDGEITYGRVEVGISTHDIKESISSTKQLSAFIAIAEMSLVALFSFFLGGYLTGQLKSLRSAAKSISTGSLDINLPVKGDDEIAEVAVAFNHMVENLKTTRKKRDEYEEELTQLNASLESQISRRTEKLEDKNQELTTAYEKLKKAQSLLLQSEKMASVGQLAAGVAHEINNPVGFVSSNLESLKDYVSTYQLLLNKFEFYLACTNENQQHDIANEIRDISDREDLNFIHDDINTLLLDSLEGTKRVRDIVQNLKNFSHADSIEHQLADINQCIESTLKMVNNEIKYNCEVIKNLQPLPEIKCNAGQLNQVFLNLIVNASHAIDKNGIINISSTLVGDKIKIEVSDNGKGISEEDIDKIFEPFFTTKVVGEGTGLGLSIVYGIIQDHSGDIQVTSERGLGTKFTIMLPVESTKNRDQAET